MKKLFAAAFATFLLSPLLASAAFCPDLFRTLKRGMSGNDVRQLQVFLIERGHLATGNTTGYFGPLTEDAVEKFQCKHMNLCSGSPAENGYGQVGPGTRAKVSQVCSGVVNTNTGTITYVNTNTNPPPVPLCALNVVPSSITNGQSATLTWTSTNTTGGVINPGIGHVPVSGSQPISATQTTIFTGAFTGQTGNALCQATLTVAETSNTISSAPCIFNNEFIASGASVTAYQSASVATGQCQSQTRTCFGGLFSGSYQYSHCSIPATTTITPTPPPTNSNIQSLKVAEVGHSLLSNIMPVHIVEIATGLGKQLALDVQLQVGAPLQLQWEGHAASPHSGWPDNPRQRDLRTEIPVASPRYDVLVLTERVAIASTVQYHDSVGFSKLWRDLAVQYNPNTRLYMYTTWVGYGNEQFWPGIPGIAEWRQRTEADGLIWEKLVADTNAVITSGPEFQIIPGHRAMMALYDAVVAGSLPWTGGNMTFFIEDGIHLTRPGLYYIALVQVATLYKMSPVGAPIPSDVSLTQAQALQLQQMAWNVVSQYSLSGVSN